LGIEPLTRGSAACSRLGCSSGLRAAGGPSHAASALNRINAIAGSGLPRPGAAIIAAVSVGWAHAAGSGRDRRRGLPVGRARGAAGRQERAGPAMHGEGRDDRAPVALLRLAVPPGLQLGSLPPPAEPPPAASAEPGLDRSSARASASRLARSGKPHLVKCCRAAIP